MISIKSDREIELMRATCKLASRTLEYIGPFVKVGISTEEINNLCHEFIVKNRATPSPLNYHGFPKSICTSRNEIICHGIPSESDILKNGDIVNIDITTYFNSFHGDTNKTFLVGEVSPKMKRLVEVTYFCLIAGIKEVRHDGQLRDIGIAIEQKAHENGYSVVEEYCGHGIGREFHEAPQVLHFADASNDVIMKEGMTFTVEPMINMGKRYCKILKDRWTVVTKDGLPSAQFEHTVLVTKKGCEILTLRSEENPALFRS